MVKANIDKVEEQCRSRRVKKEQIDVFIKTLLAQDEVLLEFDEGIWYAVIEKIIVNGYDNVVFTFRNGMDIHL